MSGAGRAVAGAPSRAVIGVLVLGVAAVPAARADSWMAARTTQVFSASGAYFAQIVPGESLGDTFGFAGAKKGRYAAATLYARQADRSYKVVADIALVNPVAPVEAFVSDQGYLLTFDNWHNVGYGKVVAVYGPGGKPVRAYELGDLIDARRIDRIKHSVSSRYWRCPPTYLNRDQQTAYFSDAFGDEYVLELATGAFRRYAGTRQDCLKQSG